MNRSEPVFYRVLHIFAAFVTVQLLWIIASLPIITLFPATITLYMVMKTWKTEGVEIGFWKTFFQLFKRNFRRHFFVGILSMFVAFILILNGWIILQMAGGFRLFLELIWLFATLLYLFLMVAIFPTAIMSEDKGLDLIKKSFALSLTLLPRVVLLILIASLMLVVIFMLPAVSAIVISLFSFIHLHVWESGVEKLTNRNS